MSYQKRSKDQLARRVAQDIHEGATVNLGIGMPTLVANHIPPDREVLLHSENGILGMGPAPAEGQEDYDLINAGKQPVTLLPGGAYFHHADSFAMIRGGHIDIALLGAFQVAQNGDIANWRAGNEGIPAVGGAMDLVSGAREVYVLTEHVTKTGGHKLLEYCTFPLTGVGVVTRIFTDLAVIHVSNDRFLLKEIVTGLDVAQLQEMTGARLHIEGEVLTLKPPAIT